MKLSAKTAAMAIVSRRLGVTQRDALGLPDLKAILMEINRNPVACDGAPDRGDGRDRRRIRHNRLAAAITHVPATGKDPDIDGLRSRQTAVVQLQAN